MDPLKTLETFWHREIPIAAAMGIEVVRYDAGELYVTARLAPNVNVHGTAFAGSLYSVCALTGWGRAWLALQSHGLEATIVLARAEIDYRRAVRADIVCCCRWDAQEPALDELEHRGRTRFELDCAIEADGGEAVRFSGVYALRKR